MIIIYCSALSESSSKITTTIWKGIEVDAKTAI